jgi:isopenicillin N synthase-like dioxygenase
MSVNSMLINAALPIIDVSDSEATAQRRSDMILTMQQALTEHGFMYATGHGINKQLIDKAFIAARQFFALPYENKQLYCYTDVDSNFGYQGVAAESLNPNHPPDLKEAFTMRNALAVAPHAQRWPDSNFRDAALTLYAAGLSAAYQMLNVMADCLKLPQDFFTVRHLGENITLRFLHYPANLPLSSQTQLGAGEHTDYGSITLLFQDNVGGLELRDANGEWRSAPPLTDSVIVNTGDLMERWTNGRFRSTLHRVQPITGNRDRYSIALFVDPDAAVEVSCIPSCISAAHPPRYPRITAGEHIRQKIAATHTATKPTTLSASELSS